MRRGLPLRLPRGAVLAEYPLNSSGRLNAPLTIAARSCISYGPPVWVGKRRFRR